MISNDDNQSLINYHRFLKVKRSIYPLVAIFLCFETIDVGASYISIAEQIKLSERVLLLFWRRHIEFKIFNFITCVSFDLIDVFYCRSAG